MTDPLLERQLALQEEAAAVLDDLELVPLLQTVGDPIKVGSMALGLMVTRDIDMTVLCPELDATRVFEAIRALSSHPRVRELRFRNDTGHWNVTTPAPNQIIGELVDHGVRDPAFCARLCGWLQGAIEATGGQGGVVTETACKCRGQARCTFELTWRP